ncbi:MASE1 domain-containing protein [Candidatus Parcubacteria bacterium]|nr:MASE1 domain-containing protein [Candidatus Parcubacteria bacterium]
MQYQLSTFEQAIKNEGTHRYLVKLILLTVVYIGLALFGLSLGVSFENITTIWLPTGIAIAALLFWGYQYLPGIFAGALLAYILSETSPVISTALATGNTLEAVAAVFLIRRFINGGQILEKISHVIRFVVLAGFLSTIISATIGTASLKLGGLIGSDEFISAWLAWWMGDMMGALLVVPLVAAWRDTRYREFLADKLFDGIFILVVIATACLIIFSQSASIAHITSPLVYLIFPLIMWASVRLIQIGAVTSAAVVSVAAIWGTIAGTGPYTSNSPDVNLAFLHIFILTIVITGLVLAVSVSGRLQAEAEVKTKAKELEQAKEQILHNIKWRKDLQNQMKNATDQINQILSGVFEDRTKGPPK